MTGRETGRDRFGSNGPSAPDSLSYLYLICEGQPLTMARGLAKPHTAGGAKLGLLPRQAIGDLPLVRDFIGAEPVSVILACLLLLSPDVGLAERRNSHEKGRGGKNEGGFQLHSFDLARRVE